MRAGSATSEYPISDGQATHVHVGGYPHCRSAGRIETRDGRSRLVQHLTGLLVNDQPPQRHHRAGQKWLGERDINHIKRGL